MPPKPDRKPLDLTVRRGRRLVAHLTAEADPRDAEELERLLADAVRRDGVPPDRIGEYEMDVRLAADPSKKIRTFVAPSRRRR